MNEERDSIDDFVSIKEYLDDLVQICQDDATFQILSDLKKKMDDYYQVHLEPLMEGTP